MTKEEIRLFYTIDDDNFLQWIFNRLSKVHGENEDRDYMLKLQKLSTFIHTQRYPDILGKDQIKF